MRNKALLEHPVTPCSLTGPEQVLKVELAKYNIYRDQPFYCLTCLGASLDIELQALKLFWPV